MRVWPARPGLGPSVGSPLGMLSPPHLDAGGPRPTSSTASVRCKPTGCGWALGRARGCTHTHTHTLTSWDSEETLETEVEEVTVAVTPGRASGFLATRWVPSVRRCQSGRGQGGWPLLRVQERRPGGSCLASGGSLGCVCQAWCSAQLGSGVGGAEEWGGTRLDTVLYLLFRAALGEGLARADPSGTSLQARPSSCLPGWGEAAF